MSRRRVFIADDGASVRPALERLVRAVGYGVSTERGSLLREGLRSTRRTPPRARLLRACVDDSASRARTQVTIATSRRRARSALPQVPRLQYHGPDPRDSPPHRVMAGRGAVHARRSETDTLEEARP